MHRSDGLPAGHQVELGHKDTGIRFANPVVNDREYSAVGLDDALGSGAERAPEVVMHHRLDALLPWRNDVKGEWR